MPEVSQESSHQSAPPQLETERLPVPSNIRTDRKTPRVISLILICSWAITFALSIYWMKNEPKQIGLPLKKRIPSEKDLNETPNLTLVQLKNHD